MGQSPQSVAILYDVDPNHRRGCEQPGNAEGPDGEHRDGENRSSAPGNPDTFADPGP